MVYGKILVVDDDALSRSVCLDILEGAGYSVTIATNGTEALAAVESADFDIVLTDLVMPGMDGIEVLDGVKQHNALIDVVVITGHSSMESAITALKKGAFEYLRKPLNKDELLLTVKSSLEKKALLEENHEMRHSLRLYKVGRTLTASLDVEKLCDITLDSLLQTLPAEAGLMLFYDEELKRLKIKSCRGLSSKSAEKLLEFLSERLEEGSNEAHELKIEAVQSLKPSVKEALSGFSSMLRLPLSKESKQAFGYVVTLSDRAEESYGLEELKVAGFIADHACQAFANAIKYASAQEMAYIDSLTNLYNAKYLELTLERELKRADRQKSSVAVLFLDIDHFKGVNDENDHIAGSKVLVEVGKIITGSIREVDTAIRYGGDEYVVILVDADCESGYHVAERIRAEVESFDFLHEEGLDLKITTSIGVAAYPTHTKEKKELLKIADSAMYCAKDRSRNTVFITPVPGKDGTDGNGA